MPSPILSFYSPFLIAPPYFWILLEDERFGWDQNKDYHPQAKYQHINQCYIYIVIGKEKVKFTLALMGKVLQKCFIVCFKSI
jgi:hypothetical protein